ncbi:serine/threonine-protein kinase [Pedococcus sp. 5OH_020]|uniref:serine/threonine-protein kinase n=1 Tax=Pedococcus sp. 5OH_020 TaxID=2989814 RepID=UPI0022E9F806|nr:serine/threonine-protein kinase [Pedococcus sp. 5OH_020]
MNRLHEGFVLGDRYVLGARIASGGMADVWAGTDQVLQRTVAVKVMRPDTGHEELFARRFRDEAVHSAALMHTNIATLFDYGEDDGLAFLVMELVKGEPLSLLLKRRGPLDPAEVRSLVGQAALALGVAHEARVVHRDIKPANILVRPDGLVKLTDFGIARALDAAGHTRAGEMLGTPDYISPEQALGEPATGASDLYALGVVAHEMLSGRRPFDRGTPVATALSHVNEPPPPLPDGIPGDLADLVDDCLAKDPANRPPNARAVAARLGIGEHEMAGLALGLASALDDRDDPDTDSDGSVLRFPDLGGPTLAMPERVQPGTA